ncbi:MAG: DUF5662 family protein [Chryseolinea sp.]
MLYRKSTQTKEAFKQNVFKLFTDAVGGDLDEFTEIVYSRFTIDDYAYHDDMYFFGVEQFFITRVIPHKIAVYEAGMRLLPKLEDRLNLDIPEEQFKDNLWLHDISKFCNQEAFGYAMHDFNNPRPSSKALFDSAWHHHKMNNPHHPEHWFSVDRKGETAALEMPHIYVAEMVADWLGAGVTYGTPTGEWLMKNYPTFNLHYNTRLALNEILHAIGFGDVVSRHTNNI